MRCASTGTRTYTRAWRKFSTSVNMSAPRDYNAAVAALNTLQSNYSIVEMIRASGGEMHKQAMPETIEWCRRAEYEPRDFNCLNAIHVAGTKGKGSTSAFISSILNQYREPKTTSDRKLGKVGLYTSPHLRYVRERIQIDNEPLPEEKFAKYFFDIWDRLENAARARNEDPVATSSKPVYFRYLTIMALHAYLKEQVDTAIIECGIGGEYDTTNILQRPAVTAITSLGIDHTAILGSTIEEIAWHKAGIFKPGVPAFTVPQPEEAMKVLRSRAEERQTSLQVVEEMASLQDIQLGLLGDFQRGNASIACAVAAQFLRDQGHGDVDFARELPPKFRRGLEAVRWPGRCDIRREKGVVWHLDGGHTLESIELAVKWFSSQIAQSAATAPSSPPRILIFNQQTRDAPALARALYETLATALKASLNTSRPFSHVIFCTNQTYGESGYKPDLVSINADAATVNSMTVQHGLAEAWGDMDPTADVKVVVSIEEAIGRARKIARGWQDGTDVMALVTGSLHLVGGALEVLEGE